MTTAIHGKASLAELLSADATSAEAGSHDDRDKTNTVDFGATLMSLIDPATFATPPAAGAIADASARVDGERTADDARASGSNTANAIDDLDAVEVEVEPGVAQTATAPRHATERASSADSDAAHPTQRKLELRGSNARASFVSPLEDRGTTIHRADTATDDPGLAQIDAHPNASADDATATSSEVSSTQPADAPYASLLAQSVFAGAKVNSAVPNPDIAAVFRKRPFPLQATDDAAALLSEKIRTGDYSATVANPAQIEAHSDPHAPSTPGPNDSPHARAERTSDGTSSALSAHIDNSNTMNSAVSKITQPIFANTGTSAQQASQTQMETIAQMTPGEQRPRIATSKEASSQLSDAAGFANDPAHGANAQPVARTAEPAAIRLNPDVTPIREPSHAVNITVQLANGQTAQASVREHAGAVDVKILTPSAASAQRVSAEMDGLRRNFDAAGIKLGHSEVSYQRGEAGGRGREGYQPRAQSQSGKGNEVFIMDEVAR